MPDFERFLDTVKDEVVALAKDHLEEMQGAAVQDGEAFLERTKDDLKRWTRLLEQGDLTREDVEWLIKAKKDLAKMEALKQAGLAAARVDRFRNALIDRVINTTVRFFL
jgi:hypothetical protein